MLGFYGIWLKSLFCYLAWRTKIIQNILFWMFFTKNWSYLIFSAFRNFFTTFLWTEFFIFLKSFTLNLWGCNFAWFQAYFLTAYPIISCEWILYQFIFIIVVRFWLWTWARTRTTRAWNSIFSLWTFQGVYWDFYLWNFSLRCHKFITSIAIKPTPRTIFQCLSRVLSLVNRKSSAEVVNIIIEACEALALNTRFFRLPMN